MVGDKQRMDCKVKVISAEIIVWKMNKSQLTFLRIFSSQKRWRYSPKSHLSLSIMWTGSCVTDFLLLTHLNNTKMSRSINLSSNETMTSGF